MIRIGDLAVHTGIFLAGITAMTPAAPNQAMLVDPTTGQLGSADVGSFRSTRSNRSNRRYGRNRPHGATRFNRRYGRNRPQCGPTGATGATGDIGPIGPTGATGATGVGVVITPLNNTAVGDRALVNNTGNPTPQPVFSRSFPIPAATPIRPTVLSLSVSTPPETQYSHWNVRLVW